MENAKLEIVKFDNADVIATSGTGSVLQQWLSITGINDATGDLKFTYGDSDGGSGDVTLNGTYLNDSHDSALDFLKTKFGSENYYEGEDLFQTGLGGRTDLRSLIAFDDTSGLAGYINGTYDFVKNDNSVEFIIRSGK